MKLKSLLIFVFFANNISAVWGQNVGLLIRGNNPSETRIIDSVEYQKAFSNFIALEREKNLTLDKLQKNGFLSAAETGFSVQNDTLYIYTFFLGKKTTHMQIQYNPSLLNDDFFSKRGIKPKNNRFSVPISETEALLESISQYYESRGYAFAKVQLENLQLGNDTLFAHLNTVSNPIRKIDSIVVRGYENFPVNYLKYFAGIKKGRIFSKEDLAERTDLLASLPFVRKSKEPEVLFRPDATVVYLYLEKVKNNTFDGFLGFSNDEDSGNLTLNGTIDFRLNNTLNRGETLQFFWKDDGNDQTRFSVSVDIPYLFNTPLGLNASLFLYRQDSTFVNADRRFNLTYLFNDQFRLAAGVKQYESDNLRDIAIATVEDLSATFFNAEVTFNLRRPGDVFFPYRLFLQLGAEVGSREAGNQTSAQQRFGIEGFYQLDLNQRNKIFVKNKSEVLLSPDYFENETFRFGGINSIRGFSENTLIATTYSVVNTEYQYIISNAFYLHSITDFAYLENEITQTTDNLISFGFGFGLQTRAGIFRLSYAAGKAKSSEFTLSDSKVHISLKAVF